MQAIGILAVYHYQHVCFRSCLVDINMLRAMFKVIYIGIFAMQVLWYVLGLCMDASNRLTS